MGALLSKGSDKGGPPRLVPGLAVRAGQTIAGKYRVEELLGSGPSGVVLAARQVLVRRAVTLKILATYTEAQAELLDRRIAKARRASRLKGLHVARILDIGLTEEAMPYVATERLEGTTLDAELAARGKLPVDEAIRWILEACEGLAEAHAAGIVHADLKPQNLFLATNVKNGGDGKAARDPRVLKILDFGSTSPLEAIGDQSASAFFGSPAFLAPEQIQDATHIDTRADIWALGALLYNLVAGSLPFQADTLSGVLVAVVYDAPALLTDAPYDLARIVARCLDKDPSKRPRDVAELAKLLAPFAAAEDAEIVARIAAILETTPTSEPMPLSDATAEDDDSMPPTSVDVPTTRDSADALPLVRRRGGRDARGALGATTVVAPYGDVTRPSQRVVRERRARRSHASAFAVLGAAAALAIASVIAEPPASRPRPGVEIASPAAAGPGGEVHASVPAFVPPGDERNDPAVPTPVVGTLTPTTPAALPNAAAAPAEPSVASPHALPPAAPATASPASVPVRALPGAASQSPRTAPARPSAPTVKAAQGSRPNALTADLPTTRSSSRRSHLSKTPPPAPPNAVARRDDTYVRNLFTERK